MTVDYNGTLLNYITGNLTVESSSSNTFRGYEEKTNNLIQELANKGINADYTIRTLTTNTTSNYLMYGTYQENNVNYGYIVILNQEGTILKIFTEYSSGTKLGPFEVLEYDNQGNIYGIDYYNNQYRVILLNNVAIETSTGFTCRLKKSYYITDSSYRPPITHLAGTSCIKKDPNNDSVYYIIGQKNDNGNKLLLIRFTINIGSSNQWDYYTGSTIANSGSAYAFDFLLQEVGNTTVADIYYVANNDLTVLEHEYFNGETLTSQVSINITTLILDFRILDSDTVYVSSRTNNGSSYTMYLYQVEGTTLYLINQTTKTIILPSYYLNLINGNLFAKISGYTDSSTFLTICGIYDGNTFVQSPDYSMTIANYINTRCAIQKTYSLYKFIVQGAVDLYRPYIVVYDNQYSGGSYVSYNSLTPLHSEIYSNSSLVFARGLYNKQVYQNMCVSTVNIPNNYLNGIPLMPSKLLGTTMLELVNNTDTITKNVYENLFINFNNKIQVIDEDNSNLFPETANYINTSVSYGTQPNYEDQKISNMKINYADDTSRTIPFYWTDNGGIKEYTYSIYVPKAINSIEFLNAEGNFTYITKQYDFEIGKTYTITQRLRVD